MKKLLVILPVILCTAHVSFSQCFAPAVEYNVGAEVRSFARADFNGDGKIDLATTNKLLTGNGTGGFTVTSIPSGAVNNGVTSMVAADFNNDGKQDLAMEYGQGILVMIGNGSGGFAAPTTVPSGSTSFIKQIITADFNSDGKKDLVALLETEIRIFLGNGAGAFSGSTVTTLTGNPIFYTITATDINGDGKMDFVAGKSIGYPVHIAPGYFSIFLGNGAGAFSAATDVIPGGHPQCIVAADLNKDGRIDLAQVSDNGGLIVAYQDATGGFSGTQTNLDIGALGFINTGDFDNDGTVDLAVTNRGGLTSIMFKNASGGYSFNDDYRVATHESLNVVTADFNQDGRLDIAKIDWYAENLSIFLATIKITTTQTNVTTCFGGNNGTATASGSCGGNFTYSWNTSPVQNTATATGLSAGTYTVTVTQGNLSKTASVTITEPTEVTVATASTNETCNGGGKNGTATANVTGGTAPYTYSWNTTPVQTTKTATNLSAGSYTVTVKDANNCTKTANVQVNYTTNPSSFSYTTNGMVVSFSRNGIGCNTFVWDFGNGNTSTINPNPTVTYLAAGTYGVCLQCNGQPTECIQCLNITVPSSTSGGIFTPAISSFSPASGAVGTAVTITGVNFSTTPANNTVKFNGTTATVTASTATSITTSAPAGATTGAITVTVDNKTASSTTDFTVIVSTTPTITSFAPASGAVGSTITITGTNFSNTPANNIVKFNGVTATVTASTATTITTTVPAGATAGSITVTVGAETGNSSGSFTITGSLAQAITFGPVGDKTMGDLAFNLSATASSSLPVSYSATSDNVTIAGTAVTMTKAGKATIKADQAGNATYSAAPQVQQTFCVNPAKPTVTISNGNTQTPTLTSSAAAGNQWYRNGQVITAATNPTLSVTTDGAYSVESTVETCKGARSSDFPVVITGDIISFNSKVLTITPNPTSDFIMMELPGAGKKEIGIFNLNGSSQEGTSTELDQTTVDVRHFAAGFYLVRVSTATEIYYGKFIKK